MRESNPKRKYRTTAIANLNYEEQADGLLYPIMTEPANNHDLTAMEQWIQTYLMEQQPSLYQELLLSDELMSYLKKKAKEYKETRFSHYQELQKHLPTNQSQQTRLKQLNQLKQQAEELTRAAIFPSK